MKNKVQVNLSIPLQDYNNMISNFYKIMGIQKIDSCGYPIIGDIDYSKTDSAKIVKLRYNNTIYNAIVNNSSRYYDEFAKCNIYDLCKEDNLYYVEV